MVVGYSNLIAITIIVIPRFELFEGLTRTICASLACETLNLWVGVFTHQGVNNIICSVVCDKSFY